MSDSLPSVLRQLAQRSNDGVLRGPAFQAADRIEALDAMLAKAREDALREAAEKCHAFMLSLSNDIPPVEHTDIDTCIILRSRILDMIHTAEGET